MTRASASAGVARARAASAAGNTAVMDKPVTTDASDPETIEANNMGGMSFPGDMPEDLQKLFASSNIDWNAPITTAQRNAQVARKGKAGKQLPERDVKLLTEILAVVTSDDFSSDDPNATTSYMIYPKHEELMSYKVQLENWVKANNMSGIALKVSAKKHRLSPVGYDPKNVKDNKGKSMIYLVTLERAEDAENTEDSDSEE